MLDSAHLYQNRDPAVTADFRQVIAPFLERHLRLDDAKLTRVFPAMPQSGDNLGGLLQAYANVRQRSLERWACSIGRAPGCMACCPETVSPNEKRGSCAFDIARTRELNIAILHPVRSVGVSNGSAHPTASFWPSIHSRQ